MKNFKNVLILAISLVLILFFFENCGSKREVDITWKEIKAPADVPVTVNFYVENTGSMNGYMCAGSEFKDVIHYYASELENVSKKENLFFINSQIIPFNGNIDTYTHGMTPSKFNRYGGNCTSSDIANMFDAMLAKADKNTVSVFVSDCILGVPYGSTKYYLNNNKDNVKKMFVKYLKKQKNLGVEIFCMDSHFDGTYYQYGKQPRIINMKRPYYMWVVGPQEIIGKLNKQVNPEEFPHAYKYNVSYSSCSLIPFTILNEYGLSSNSTSLILRCKDEKAHAVIRADLSATLKDNKFLQDVSNFQTKSPLVKIDRVKEIDNDKYTHEISLSIFNNAHLEENILVGSVSQPSWINGMSDDTGNDLRKTQGISYIINGVADAYKNVEHNGIKLKIK